jgi:hypothetical protein
MEDHMFWLDSQDADGDAALSVRLQHGIAMDARSIALPCNATLASSPLSSDEAVVTRFGVLDFWRHRVTSCL